MSAIADLVAFDGAATPVSHTLKPVQVTRTGGKVTAEWRENLSSIPVYAQVKCTMTMERLKGNSGVYKTDTRVEIPVMESISGQNASGYTAAPKVAYVNTVVVTGFFHERSDAAGRRLARQFAVNIANGVLTTVTPVQTGPVPELIDLLIAPT